MNFIITKNAISIRRVIKKSLKKLHVGVIWHWMRTITFTLIFILNKYRLICEIELVRLISPENMGNNNSIFSINILEYLDMALFIHFLNEFSNCLSLFIANFKHEPTICR